MRNMRIVQGDRVQPTDLARLGSKWRIDATVPLVERTPCRIKNQTRSAKNSRGTFVRRSGRAPESNGTKTRQKRWNCGRQSAFPKEITTVAIMEDDMSATGLDVFHKTLRTSWRRQDAAELTCAHLPCDPAAQRSCRGRCGALTAG